MSQYVRALVLRETRVPAFTGSADPARTRRTQHAFGEAAADSRDSRERWRDL